LDRATGYVIGFRGGRPPLERPGRTQKFRLKAIDKGEKLFERFTWLGELAAPRPVSGINTVPVPIGVRQATAISGDALNYVAASTITAAVRESIQINGANVLQANIQTDNGIIHIIDKVLVPFKFGGNVDLLRF
jgi:hypothetical protein